MSTRTASATDCLLDDVKRLTVEQYHAMQDHAVLLDGDPVELLEGVLYRKDVESFYRLSVQQYHKMIRMGIVDADDRVELLEGILIAKMPKNPSHALCLRLIGRILESLLSAKYHLITQDPLTTRESEPEPDACIVRGEIRAFTSKHPGPKDVAVVFEVSDTTLARDRGIKKRVYAKAGIAEYWIVNLKDECVEVYSSPVAGREPSYRSSKTYGKKESVPVVLDGKELGRVSVKEILP